MTENPDYIRCLEGSHLGLIHKYAGIGDGIYSNWDYSPHKSYIQANFAARFVGELVAPFHKLSLVHKSTALSEVAKQKLAYQQWLHIPVKWKEGAWGECVVDCFVEGIFGFLTKYFAIDCCLSESAGTPACRELDVSEYPSYLLPEPTSKHMKEKVVLIEDEFYKKWVSLCVHVCTIVTDVCGEAWVKDDPRAKYLQTSNHGRFAEAWLIPGSRTNRGSLTPRIVS